MTRFKGPKRARATRYTTELQAKKNGQLLQLEDAQVDVAQVKPTVRGPNKIRDVETAHAKKPEVWPIGAAEFDYEAYCNMITGTISKLALRAMPAPLRSYNSWDRTAKKVLQDQFLIPSLY
jgi:hypothetical protein